MARKLKLSPYATDQMYRVRNRLRLEKREFLWTLRIALSRSIQTGRSNGGVHESTSENKAGSRPFEIEVPTLEQGDALLLRALLQQYYERKLSEAEYEDLLEKHVKHGLELLDNETERFSGFEYLVAIARKGLNEISTIIDVSEEEITDTAGYDGVISIRVGVNKENNEPHVINFNKIDEHNNNYIGVVGRPGSGKTYFMMHFLTELRKASKFQTNFIAFDYKGDLFDKTEFLRNTKAQLIQVSKEPIPINVFKTRNTYTDRKFAAERLVGIVRDVEARIGKVQEDNLYNAIINAYERVMHDDHHWPDFHMVRDELEKINDRPDSLTSVFRPLTEHNLFASREMPAWNSLVDRTVVIDIHDLPAQKDLCVFFVLNELYKQLIQLPDSNVDPTTHAREMRTVIVIDEAHHFLRSKKRVEVLENLIREIRSKGASVMLLSQSPDDYDKADFNFLEMLEFVYVLGCNPSSHKFLQQMFGVSPEQAKRLMRDVTGLGQGQAFGKNSLEGTSILSLCK